MKWHTMIIDATIIYISMIKYSDLTTNYINTMQTSYQVNDVLTNLDETQSSQVENNDKEKIKFE